MNNVKRTSTALVAVTALLIVAATTMASPAVAATTSQEEADVQGWVNVLFAVGVSIGLLFGLGLWSLGRHQNRVSLKQQAADDARQAIARKNQKTNQVQVRGGKSDQRVVEGGRPWSSQPNDDPHNGN